MAAVAVIFRRVSARPTLVHGDFRNGNLLVDDSGLVALLDWELAHIGDPIQDLSYLSAKALAIDNPKYSGLAQARARWGETTVE